MSNTLIASIELEGIRPLLWHNFGLDSLPLQRQERTGVAGNDPEEWRKTVSVTDNKQLYIAQSNIFSCIREGSKYTKKGKGSIQTDLSATLQVIDDKVLVDRYLPDNIEMLVNMIDELVYLDVRAVKNPTTKGRNVRYRVAASPGWTINFKIMWDKTIISSNQMEASLIDAGKLAGLGDGRKIGNGRFELIRFEVSDYAKTKTT